MAKPKVRRGDIYSMMSISVDVGRGENWGWYFSLIQFPTEHVLELLLLNQWLYIFEFMDSFLNMVKILNKLFKKIQYTPNQAFSVQGISQVQP